jgi:hypothetical protein
MTAQWIETIQKRQPAGLSKAEFIKELLLLRDKASMLGMSRVALCLDYAHWEVISAEPAPVPI